ncbi:MAG: adenylyl-sulfate kinase [Acidimicrobiia bacterium]|nr:adenylyl-sulfate kinase [Acidimicrobiia bacterium]
MTEATPNTVWHEGELDRAARWETMGVRGATVWLTGLSGSGKSTIAAALERLLVDSGQPAYRLDGDNLRQGINGDLGFSAEDRTENIRRVGQIARLFADAGVVALVPVISPYRSDRDAARAVHAAAGLPFVEIFVDTPLEVCEQRDPKGLYVKARAGEIKGFTGIDDPYEAPESPELVIDTTVTDVADAAQMVFAMLRHPSL